MGEMLLNGRLYGASGIRELTQAQYDALPASKLTDGVLYCIKDTGIVEGDKYAPVIYSLEEREIGVWIDGKPLYQKTITGLSFRTAISNWASTGVTLTNVDRVVKCEIGQSFSSLIEICFAQVENDVLQVWTTNNETYEFNIVNIQYTKSTDIPGSGTWGTDGVPMVHYDGNEKIIGTWFGETLYQKTISIDAPIMNTYTEVLHGISGLKECTHIFGRVFNSDGNVWNNIPLQNMNSQYIIFCGNVSNTSFRYQFGSGFGNTMSNMKVTIQYTKTS